MIYLKRDAELGTVYNKFEVWLISDTPALQRFFLMFSFWSCCQSQKTGNTVFLSELNYSFQTDIF